MKRYVAAGSVGTIGLLLSCVTEPCACPPARSHLALDGVAINAAGAPLPQALVRLAETREADCGAPLESFELTLSTGGPAETVTDAAGRFRLEPYSFSGPGRRCLFTTIVRGAADVSDSVTVGTIATFQLDSDPPDTLHLRIAFPD